MKFAIFNNVNTSILDQDYVPLSVNITPCFFSSQRPVVIIDAMPTSVFLGGVNKDVRDLPTWKPYHLLTFPPEYLPKVKTKVIILNGVLA